MVTSKKAWSSTLTLVVLACASVAMGQWAASDGIPIVNRAGDAGVPKIHVTPDGGCYIAWFENQSGYDVNLQRLDAAGYEQWAHNGIVVAARSVSWTQDFGLDVDASGNAVMIFLDDRFGGMRVTATKIAPDGTHLWGANGVQLTPATADPSSPAVTVTSDGYIVCAWTEYLSAGAAVKLQKLDPDGNVVWTSDTTLADLSGGNFYLCDVQQANDGSVIVSWVRTGPNFYDPKHIWAQKIAGDGNLLWGASHVIVFDGGSLQFGNFPDFLPDGSGGAVFGWYFIVGSALDCAAQHILADGTEAFGHNGALGSTNSSMYRVSPSVSFDPVTSETFLFWNEMNTAQSQNGVYGQKFDASGSRQWGNNGAVLLPVGTDSISWIQQVQYDDGAMVAWLQSASYGNDKLRAARVDDDGSLKWVPTILDVTPTLSGKSRLAVTLRQPGAMLLAWMDDRGIDNDIYAQNIFGNGTMGTCLYDLNYDGTVGLSDLAQLLSNYGMTGGAMFVDGDLDGDGDIDLSDLAALLSVYGGSCN